MGYRVQEIIELTPLQKAALVSAWRRRNDQVQEAKPLSDLLYLLPKSGDDGS